MLRTPIVADQFYPGAGGPCLKSLRDCLQPSRTRVATPAVPVGGICPHAGWMCSGRVAGRVYSVLGRVPVDTVVLFGAVHRAAITRAAVFDAGQWQTPLGTIEADQVLAVELLKGCRHCAANPEAHQTEHSIEVQMPFVKHEFPSARMLAVMVPPTDLAVQVGSAVADAARRAGRRIVVVGTTDLTHYGPGYGFVPHGRGAEGIAWAKKINDRRFIELMLRLDARSVVEEAATHRNACGAGAVAATISACRALGADRAVLLEHVTSRDVLGAASGDNAVGYAAVVLGTDQMN